jgi:hypothetical protein
MTMTKRKVLLASVLLAVIATIKHAFSSDLSSLIPTMAQSEIAQSEIATATNSATGTLFQGEQFRSFQGVRLFPNGYLQAREKIKSMRSNKKLNSKICTKWGVVTTIFNITDAIVRVAKMGDGWCLVVVADTITPKHYLEQANLQDDDSIFFLSVEKQREWMDMELGASAGDNGLWSASPIGEFIRATPWKHFARKNLGYLHAVIHGAKFIFDFDDDNFVKKDVDGNVISILPDEKQMKNVSFIIQGKNVFNPYPMMGASIESSWPRGFPLESIQDEYTRGTVLFSKNISMDSIGVIQFCADGDPDVDAIHRLIKKLPMVFGPHETTASLVVPSHAFVPYNAQATIHTAKAFWATLLPSTVPGRVSDIWRSYFAECLFRDLDLKVVFAPPKIEQIRNAHNYMGDRKAEQDLYFKSGTLVQFLNQWSSPLQTIPERMEQLWIDLYERGYIEEDDIKAVQLWLAALIQGNYEFPKIEVSNRRHQNVALMGQFNFNAKTNNVVYWIQKWRRFFDTIVVRGPFNETQLQQFKSHSVNVYYGGSPPQHAFFSPVSNLMHTLLQFKKSHVIEGVLYLHDDALLDMNVLSQGVFPFPTQSIIGNSLGRAFKDPSYKDPRVEPDEQASLYSYRIYPNGTYANHNGTGLFSSLRDMDSKLERWPQRSRDVCAPGQRRFAMDPRSEKYREPDGSILFPSYTQADFLYVPTKLADDFSGIAKLLLEHNIWIECNFGKIVDELRHRANGTVRVVPLCTTSFKRRRGTRGTISMLKNCMQPKGHHGVYHPYKMRGDVISYDAGFDAFHAGSL